MKRLLLLTFVLTLSLNACVTKDRKCVKEHKKARKNHIGWQN